MKDERLHVLFLAGMLPWPPPLSGAQLRITYLLKELLRHYRVSFASVGSPEDLSTLSGWPMMQQFESTIIPQATAATVGSRWGGARATLQSILPSAVPIDITERAPRPLLAPLTEMARGAEVDVVWATRSWMAELAKTAGFSRIVVDVDDFEGPVLAKEIEQLRPYRRESLHRILVRRLNAYESQLPTRFQVTVIAKSEDRDAIAPALRDRVVLVRNGINPPEHVTDIRYDPPTMLFVGALGYRPNMDAVEWFATSIFPKIRVAVPDARFVIAGKGPVPASLSQLASVPGITVVESPADVASVYDLSSVVVAPIRLGNGTRLKVLEALGFGRPLVGTTEVVSGLGLTPDTHFLCADDPQLFADQCLRLLRDRALALTIAHAGRSHVLSSATWTVVTQSVPAAVELCMSSGAQHA